MLATASAAMNRSICCFSWASTSSAIITTSGSSELKWRFFTFLCSIVKMLTCEGFRPGYQVRCRCAREVLARRAPIGTQPSRTSAVYVRIAFGSVHGAFSTGILWSPREALRSRPGSFDSVALARALCRWLEVYDTVHDFGKFTQT